MEDATARFVPAAYRFGLGGLLVGQDFHLFDLDFVGEEGGGVGHQGFGDLAVQVGVAAFLVVEGVEDAVHSGAELDAVPGYGLRLFEAHGRTLLQERLNIFLFARLRFNITQIACFAIFFPPRSKKL
jgi:hypothetical protein